MKIKMQLKDPDGVYESIREAAEKQVSEMTGLRESEKESIIENRHEEISEQLEKWIEWGEYITIEFDTETATATVLQLK